MFLDFRVLCFLEVCQSISSVYWKICDLSIVYSFVFIYYFVIGVMDLIYLFISTELCNQGGMLWKILKTNYQDNLSKTPKSANLPRLALESVSRLLNFPQNSGNQQVCRFYQFIQLIFFDVWIWYLLLFVWYISLFTVALHYYFCTCLNYS